MDKELIIRYFKEGNNSAACNAAGINFAASYSELVSEYGAGRISPTEYVDEMTKLRGRILMNEDTKTLSLLPRIEVPVVLVEGFDDLLTKASGLSSHYKELALEYGIKYIRHRLFMEPCEHPSTGLGKIISSGLEESFGFYRKHVEMLRSETVLWAKKQYTLENIKRIAQWEASLENPNKIILRMIENKFVSPKEKISEDKKFEYLEFILYHLKGQGYLD